MVRQYWNLFWKFRKLQLMRMLEFRGDFFFWGGVSALWTLFNFFFFTIIVDAGNGIAGWTKHEIYLLLSVFTILDAFTWSFFYHNMMRYTQSIYDGELNNLLLKPINPQFLLMTQSNNFTNAPRLLIGIAMFFWSLNQLNISISPSQILWFFIIFIFSLIFVYFFWFFLSTFAFYFEKLDNINEIIPSLRRLWQIPRSVFSGIFGLIMTYVLPMSLITSLPSETLLQTPNVPLILYFVGITCITIYLSNRFFLFSIKKYSGVAN